ncbi:hypothetical protein RHMOL_Rhmol12G0228800 [Rhododendron molle]|uniref:Uncharacterized protein n=1 Tax=Rhododendron molle TaxID=49168 RepID=A0ACC0LLC1_RHOML|nr:hypothetical protein RHMOL_Rhmol12G0228800 [Rhododendron molle]
MTSPKGIPDWETTGTVEYIKSGATQDHMLLIVPAGMYAVRLGNDAAIKQKLTLTPGMFYSLTFSAARTCGQQEKLKVSVSPSTEAGGSGVLPIQTVYSSNGWDSYSWGFVAEADQVEISIHNPGNRAVQLMAGRESIIVQIVRTTPGKVYDLTFAVGDASNSCEGSMVVEAFAGKESFKVPYESSGKGGFKRAKLRFTASSPMTRVKFLSSYYHMKSDHSGSLCGPVVDDVMLVVVNAPPKRVAQHKHA